MTAHASTNNAASEHQAAPEPGPGSDESHHEGGSLRVVIAALAINVVIAGIKFVADQPNIQDIYFAALPSALQPSALSVPYYSQAVNYLGALDLFENSFFEGFASHATTLD